MPAWPELHYGGIVEQGETPEQCVIRETEEETGLEIDGVVEIGRFLSHGPDAESLRVVDRTGARTVGDSL
jgi:8-oxo-dGTP pyrophosphatase MutT (NUDIX family)